jgi:hypothetical protein
MAESYKKAKLITTAGASNGFIGFQNIHSAPQNVTVSGPFIYGSTGPQAPVLITNIPVGAIIPLNCATITPASGSVLGFLN